MREEGLSDNDQVPSGVSAEEALRADLYDYLAALLARPPDRTMIDRTRALSGDETDIGQAIVALSRVATTTNPAAAEREYNRLFIGVGRGELVPYASFYMTGFLNEKPLASLRTDMTTLGIERAPDVFEPEDSIASLCEMMAGLIRGRFGAPVPVGRQREFFNRHLGAWAPHFFTDLEAARGSLFYAPVGALGRAFMAVEKEAFKMVGADAA